MTWMGLKTWMVLKKGRAARFAGLLALGLVLSGGPVFAQSDTPEASLDGGEAQSTTLAVSVETDRSEVKLGEPVVLTLRVSGGAEASDYRLAHSLNLGSFVELARESVSQPLGGKRVQVIKLTVACFDETGDLSLPALEIIPDGDGSSGEALSVPPTPIKVVSVLDGIAEPLPLDIAGPVEVNVSDYRSLVLAGLVLGWLAFGLVLWRRREPLLEETRFESLPPPRRAHEIAMEKLRAVVDDDLLRKGAQHEYFTRISEILREYMGNRYTFFALDLTVVELIEEVRDRLTPGLDLEMLERVLKDADLVKFARLEPSNSLCSTAINDAYGLIESTRVLDQEQEQGQVA